MTATQWTNISSQPHIRTTECSNPQGIISISDSISTSLDRDIYSRVGGLGPGIGPEMVASCQKRTRWAPSRAAHASKRDRDTATYHHVTPQRIYATEFLTRGHLDSTPIPRYPYQNQGAISRQKNHSGTKQYQNSTHLKYPNTVSHSRRRRNSHISDVNISKKHRHQISTYTASTDRYLPYR